ncbi:hypothetical protein GCM10018785_47310 [Streptomyces longispororuber]|uniref:Uncharacterized protein n=1 Tax=Streptomyces longispororuber TaxID=68230 RepID=A0A918ZXV0_9ACTN|nr:hypothetical protein GCM10018785_47310 [Streptomyces longispororuber]
MSGSESPPRQQRHKRHHPQRPAHKPRQRSQASRVSGPETPPRQQRHKGTTRRAPHPRSRKRSQV